MKTPEISSCPFCGGEATFESRAPGGTMSSGMEPRMRRVGCKSCAVWTEWEHPKEEWGKQPIRDQEFIDRLAILWNRRALTQVEQ